MKCEESLHDSIVDGSMVLFYGIPGTRLSDSRDWGTRFCNVVCKALHAHHTEGGHETYYHGLNWLSCEQAVAAKLDVYWPLQCSHHLS